MKVCQAVLRVSETRSGEVAGAGESRGWAQLHDYTSVLALLERKWNLPALTYRDANANDLTDFLDLGARAARRPTFATLPPLAAPGDTAAALACSTSGPGTIPPPGSVTG